MTEANRKRQEIIGNLRLIWKEPLLLVFIIAIFYFLFIFVLFPLFMVFKTSLIVDKQFDLSNYLAIFSKRYYFQPFINSMILGVLAATAGTILGFVFAYAITRTPLPFKRFFRMTATFPIISPPFVVALAAILLFGRAGSLPGQSLCHRHITTGCSRDCQCLAFGVYRVHGRFRESHDFIRKFQGPFRTGLFTDYRYV